MRTAPLPEPSSDRELYGRALVDAPPPPRIAAFRASLHTHKPLTSRFRSGLGRRFVVCGDYLWGLTQLLRMQSGQGARATSGRYAADSRIGVGGDGALRRACRVQRHAVALLINGRGTSLLFEVADRAAGRRSNVAGSPLLLRRARTWGAATRAAPGSSGRSAHVLASSAPDGSRTSGAPRSETIGTAIGQSRSPRSGGR